MCKTLFQLMALAILLIPLNDYATAEVINKAYTGCIEKSSKPQALIACRQRCANTYTKNMPGTASVEKSQHHLTCEGGFDCLCDYEIMDGAAQSQKNSG